MTHTKDKLAEALRGVGLIGMAGLAEQGYYHDFLSPLDLPEMELVNQLSIAVSSAKDEDNRKELMDLRTRVINGEFDASKEESDEWAASPEGQATFGRLIRGKD